MRIIKSSGVRKFCPNSKFQDKSSAGLTRFDCILSLLKSYDYIFIFKIIHIFNQKTKTLTKNIILYWNGGYLRIYHN